MGGLNFYGLIVLYIAFLIYTNEFNYTDNIDILIKFIKFLAYDFNPHTTAVYL